METTIPISSPAANAVEYILKRARAAIQKGEYERAHRLLLSLVELEPRDPEYWFLMAWTAPERTAAIAYFIHLRQLQPGSPLAQDGLAWSQTEWSDLRSARRAALEVGAFPGSSRAAVPADFRSEYPERSLAVYMLGMIAAECVTTFLNPQLGLAIHGVLLVLMLLHASLGASGAQQKFLFTLALAPLIRLLSLSMPLLQFRFVYWYMIIGAPLFLAAILVMRLTGFSPKQVGLSLGTKWPLQAAVGLSGLALGWAEYHILKPAPLIELPSLRQAWLPALILLVFTGFLEELIFRGLMQQAVQEVLGRFGLVYVSLLFAVLHIGYRSWVDFVFVLYVGLIFSLVARTTRSIWGVTLAHGLTNVALFLIFPFL